MTSIYFLQVKLFRKPQEHAERIFNILVSHIKAHYDNGYKTYIASQIRLAVSGFYVISYFILLQY